MSDKAKNAKPNWYMQFDKIWDKEDKNLALNYKIEGI